jgi:DNA repair protein RecN (Recombination protein N)
MVLTELTIQDFAIIEQLHLRFEDGFNVLTGETGAGKSIIVDAVSLLLGGRGAVDVIRAGADRATIEGVFSLDTETQDLVNPTLEQDDLGGDDVDLLILAREIRREGRNVSRVNGRAVSLRVLKEIGQCLVDIHGQTEHLSLMRVREHIDLLDRYGELWPLRERIAGLVRELRGVQKELANLRQDERELARRVDLLRYQVGEIEAARLVVGEGHELEQERVRLANAERLTELVEEAFLALYEAGEDQASAVDLLQAVTRALTRLSQLDSSTSSLGSAAEEVLYKLEDLAGSLRDYRAQVEFNPRRLDEVVDRLAVLRNLQRKYGDSIEDVLDFADRASQELDKIEHSEERIIELEAQEEHLLCEIGRTGEELSAARRAAGDRLAVGIEAELKELSMPRARFAVDIAWRDAADGAYAGVRRVAFDLTGLDRVEFLVAPNVGEPLKPLVRIASGGETSRLMLALKGVLARADRTPTLIFDEIDAGIGGRIGAVVGQKLWGLTIGDGTKARRHQVLCVTHLPQLAGYGDLHLQVSKGVVGDRTVTGVRPLDADGREREIAGMLGAVTVQTCASAREMLEASEKRKRDFVSSG